MHRRTFLAMVLTAAVVAGCGNSAADSSSPASASPRLARDRPVAPLRTPVHRTQADHDTIAWYERGRGRTLLLLTGTGSTMAEFDPALLSRLARRHRLLLMDYVGIGWSSPLRGTTITFAGMADQTAAFLRARGLAGVDVLGWSMGGFVAQQLAIRHPRLVRRLVLAGTNPGGTRTVLGPKAAQDVDSDPTPSDRAALRELYPLTRTGQAQGRAFLRRLERASASGTIPDDFRVSARTARAQVKAEDPWLRSDANFDELRDLGTPVLAAAGRQDRVVPPVNLRRIAAHVPNGTFRSFAGSHGFLFSDRVRFTADLDRFLSAPDAGAP